MISDEEAASWGRSQCPKCRQLTEHAWTEGMPERFYYCWKCKIEWYPKKSEAKT